MNIVFVGGVHGVGKTHLCTYVANVHSVKHLSASQIIKEQASRNTLRTDKSVADVISNQQLLLDGLSRYRQQVSHLLLDGHFVLRTDSDSVSPIPLSVFEEISPLGVILLTAATEVIASRLARKGVYFEKSFIQKFQNAEVAQAKLFAESSSVSLVELVDPTVDGFLETVISTFGDSWPPRPL